MSTALRLRFRSDLRSEPVLFGGRPSWVVHDPVSGRYFQFDDREHQLLQSLDGSFTLDELIERFRDSRRDEVLGPQVLVRFLADARRSGLLVTRGGLNAPEPPEAGKRSRFQLFSSQIPLFNPDAMLTELNGYLRRFYSPIAVALYVLLIASAAFSILVRFSEFTERLPAASSWLTPSMLAVVSIVLFVCKILHELGHGLAAKHFGAKVEECGVLFLLFVPCFYVDVSGAWAFRSAAKRVLTSAAGMLVELALAAMATWLWWFSHPGPVQAVCLAVMATCSISTVLINGNPLMRFDGYFILVDLLGLPNLAVRSARWWSMQCDRWIWGLPAPIGADEEDWRFAVYGAASAVYRIVVLGGVLWFLHRAAKDVGLESLTLVFGAVAFAGLAIRSGKMAARPLSDPILVRMLKPRRVGISLAVLGAVVGLLLLIPFPRRLDVDCVINPRDAVSVFVTAPGEVRTLLPAGSEVAEGVELAVLENLSLKRELEKLIAEEQVVELRLDHARLRRGVDSEAGNMIPSLTESLASLRERHRLLEKDVRELTIVSPAAGRLMPPPNVPSRPVDARELRSWEGTPFDPENAGCYLERGSLLGQVVQPGALEAIAFVSQRQIERVRPGQTVRLMMDGSGDLTADGTITEVGASPVDRAPRELAALRRIPTDPAHPEEATPLEPYYRVRVELTNGTSGLIPGETGLARLRLAPESLGSRLMSAIADAFRFEL